MLYREIITVCSQIHTKHINTLCGQNAKLLNVKLAVRTVTTVVRIFNNTYCTMKIISPLKLPTLISLFPLKVQNAAVRVRISPHVPAILSDGPPNGHHLSYAKTANRYKLPVPGGTKSCPSMLHVCLSLLYHCLPTVQIINFRPNPSNSASENLSDLI